jgi:hypothetical protein
MDKPDAERIAKGKMSLAHLAPEHALRVALNTPAPGRKPRAERRRVQSGIGPAEAGGSMPKNSR